MKRWILLWMLVFLIPCAYSQSPQQAFEIRLEKQDGKIRFMSTNQTLAIVGTDEGMYRYEITDGREILHSSAFSVPSLQGDFEFNIYAPYFENAGEIRIYENGIEILRSKLSLENKSDVSWLIWLFPAAIAIYLVYLEINRLRHHSNLEQSKINYRLVGIQNFITSNLKKGFTKEQIRNALLKNHSLQEIDKAFALMSR